MYGGFMSIIIKLQPKFAMSKTTFASNLLFHCC